MGPGFRQDDPVIWTAERDRQRRTARNAVVRAPGDTELCPDGRGDIRGFAFAVISRIAALMRANC
jgi:hypothetical protein